MLTDQVRVKLVLLLILVFSTVLSTVSLTKAKACEVQRCLPIYYNGQLAGYGCVSGSGGFIECWATVQGCTIIYCAD